MSIYGKAVVFGVVMGPLCGIVAFLLSLLGCPRGIALAAAVGVLSASMGAFVMKLGRSK